MFLSSLLMAIFRVGYKAQWEKKKKQISELDVTQDKSV